MPLSAFIGAGSLSRDRHARKRRASPCRGPGIGPCSCCARYWLVHSWAGCVVACRNWKASSRCSTVAAIVSSTDASGRITHVNELFCYLSGYSREELIGRNHNVINSGLHPRKFFMDMYRNIATGHPWPRRDLQPGQERRSLLARHHHHPDHRQLGPT